jgi:arylsulfatase A-like enzyme
MTQTIGSRPSTQQPNILLLTSDEERFALPQPAGFELPARERLQERGVTFDHYYVASAQCSSSRSVIYTGRHMPITEIYDNDNMPYIRPLDPPLGTLGSMLRTAGYYCAYQGKWHLSRAYKDPADPRPTTDALEPYGFSEFNDWGDLDGGAWAGLKIDPVIAGQAVKWLRNRAPVVRREQPWFLAVNFVNPHDVMSYDYGGRRLVAPPPNLAEAMVVRPPAGIPLYAKTWDLDLPATVGEDLTAAAPAVREYAAAMETMFGPVPDTGAWRLGLNFYLNCTRDVDRSIDVVLEASGQADRTVVVFTSDHGEMAGSHGLRQKGNLVYDENFHVPFVISHPDHRGGGRSDALGSALDLAPTLLDVAGVDEAQVAERFPGLHGHSLLPALSGATVREGVLTAVEIVTTLDHDFWHALGDPGGPERVQQGTLRPDWHKRGFLRGYTDHRYTFGRYFSPLAPNRPRTVERLLTDNDVVLYDRHTDPHEQVNLAADPANHDLVATLLARLEALIDTEIGPDERAWVPERPRLVAWPSWRGDAA